MSSSPSLTAAEPASASWGDLLRGRNGLRSIAPVSYTHLTLPTKRIM